MGSNSLSIKAVAGHRYRAFISYSRAVDGRLAPILRRALHAFAKPWYRLRAMRVFRDDASLSANPDLWSSIESAIDDSDYFILLASPEACRSTWVNREVEHWLATRSNDRLLIVLTDGDLDWSSATANSDRSALPSALRGAFTAEPRHVDLRWARTVEDLSYRQPRFRECVADLAATLHGRSKDELIGDDVRYHRRAVRLAGSGAIALAVVAMLAVTLAVVATRARDQAEMQARVATSRFLAGQALGDSADLLDRALVLSVEAQGLHDSPDTRGALLNGLNQAGSLAALLHANAPVDEVEYSPDGLLLAAAAEDGTVTLWDTATRQPAGPPLVGHDTWVDTIAFAPNGRTLVSADISGTIMFWDVPSRSRVGREYALHAEDLAISPDSRLLVSAGEHGVVVWDVEQHSNLGELPFAVGTDVRHVEFSPDGRTLVTGDSAGAILLWNLPTEPTVLPESWPYEQLATQANSVHVMSMSKDGSLLAVGDGSDVVLWDLARRRVDGERLAGSIGNVVDVAFSPDGTKLVVGGSDVLDGIVVWDVAERSQGTYLHLGRTGIAEDLAVDPTGTMVAAAANDNRIRLWDITDSSVLDTLLRGRTGAGLSAVAFSSDGRTVAAGDTRATVELWDVAQGTPRYLLQHGNLGKINDAAFSPDRAVLAVAGSDNWISLWNVTTGEQAGELIHGYSDDVIEDLGGLGGVVSIAFSPDGRMLAAATNGKVQLWELPSGRPLGGPLPAPEGPTLWSATRIALNVDGTVLAIGGSLHGEIALWDLHSHRYTGQILRMGDGGVTGLAFSPDRRTLVASQGGLATAPGSVHGWNIDTGAEWGPPLTGFPADVAVVAFDAVGDTLAVGSAPFFLSLWDTASQQRIGPPLASGEVIDMAFGPNGRVLATVDGTRSVGLWDLDPASWRQHACAIANRNLSRAEWTQYLGAEVPYRSTCPGLPTPGG